MKLPLTITVISMLFFSVLCLTSGCSGSNTNKESHLNVPPTPTSTLSQTQEVPMKLIPTHNQNKTKLTYDRNRSEGRILSTLSDLEPYLTLADFSSYTETYFKEKSLLLITQSVKSGSISVSVDTVTQDKGQLNVTLSYNSPQTLTWDMTTWLLWVEIDKTSDKRPVVIINPSLTSDLAVY